MPQYILKDGTSTTTDRRLDRIATTDQRRLDFPIQAALNADQQQLVSNLWNAPTGAAVLDQGQEGACVGYGVTNELLWNPVPIPNLDGVFAREKIYWVAQNEDPWPGGSYPGANPRYEGTSVAFGIKAAADLGYYREWRWATSETDMALGVGHIGPAIIGVDWYEGMYNPDSRGFIHPTGAKAGGHCTLIIGIDVKAGHYILHNSWGPGWGNNGNCKIKRRDMAKLIADQGEICIITDRETPPPPKTEAEQAAANILPTA